MRNALLFSLFAAALASAAPQRVIAQSAQPHWVHLRRVMAAVLQSSPQRDALWDEHARIAAAIAAGDAKRATALAEHHGRQASANLRARLSEVLTKPPLKGSSR